MFKSASHSKGLSYFDVRLKHGHKNTILVKGNQFEVESVPVDGSVKILTKEDLHVKRVRLALVGEYQCEYYEKDANGDIAGQVIERNCVLKVVWPNLLTSANGELLLGNYGDSMVKFNKLDSFLRRSSRNNSLSSLLDADPSRKRGSETSLSSASGSRSSSSRPQYSRTKSVGMMNSVKPSLFTIPRSGIDGTPYPQLAGTSDAHSFLLPKGNYSMPFHIRLPADISESVEGLSRAKLRYKFECSIERGRLEKDFTTARHVRIVRTLHPQNMNLVSLIEFSNTWAGKLEFSVTLPHKALALGTKMPIKLIIVPLVKGLSFKGMWAEIVQHSCMRSLSGDSPMFQNITEKHKIECHDSDIHDDHWVIKGHYQLPCSLQDVTQSCDLKGSCINVKHRVRVLIQIKNADGHVSELRANMPIQLYISPNHGKVTTRHLEIEPHHGYFTSDADPEREDVIFNNHRDDNDDDSAEDGSGEENVSDFNSNSAPPLYQQHYADAVYDQLSPRSPMEQLRINGIKCQLESYFDIPVGKSLKSGTLTPSLDVNLLLKVPSYDQAVDEDSEDSAEEPAPLYMDTSLKGFVPVSAGSKLSERSASMSKLSLSSGTNTPRRLALPPQSPPRTLSSLNKHHLSFHLPRRSHK